MPRYRKYRRERSVGRVLVIVLVVALLGATAALVQTRRELARASTGSGQAPEASGAPAATAPGTADAAGAGAAGVETRAEGSGPRGASGSAASASAAAPSPTEGFLRVGRPGEDYTAAYVIDRSSGRVLYEHNADTPVPTASMAKMMTSLIVMDEIDTGRLSLDDSVTISARASRMGGSQIYAREGQKFTVETLLAATMVQSANDAATALAEKVAGSVEAFADLMNRRARELGLQASTFYDPHGLPSREGREDVMGARDLAILGDELLRYPLMQEHAATATLPFENATFTSGMTNPNRMLGRYQGAYGIKTGYTAAAGFSITAAARRGDTDVIAVVTGAKTSRGPESSFELAGRLMDQVFLSWSTVVPVREGEAVGEAPVRRGAKRTVSAVAAQDLRALVPRGSEQSVRWTYEPEELEAPVESGEPAGTVVVFAGNDEVARVQAVAADAVEMRPWWRFWGG